MGDYGPKTPTESVLGQDDSPVAAPTAPETEGLEPIAIVGLSCRYPGDASNPQKLWAKLASGASAWSKGPGSRWNMEAFHDPSNPHASTVSYALLA